MKETIINPVIRDEVTFTQTAAQTGGRISALLVRLMPGGGTPLHYHKNFSETFSVVEGLLTLTLANRKLRLSSGEKFTVEKGMVHRFSNESGQPVLFTTVILPGSAGFEHALRVLYGLAADGQTDAKGIPRNPLILAAVSDMSDMHPAGIAVLFTPLFALLGCIAKVAGVKRRLFQKYCV
ncbi:cupin domain-containing protein [Chitinophaga pollutisoli]|uniref:Cupin domain-containing protein n=1 Tax=Chitinophaga pollutisoli TaxID=3133966 RepID=A0ABZ2YLH7_9BACT